MTESLHSPLHPEDLGGPPTPGSPMVRGRAGGLFSWLMLLVAALLMIPVVSVLSNVLRKNSAEAHQAMAQKIHRLIEMRHGVAPVAPTLDDEIEPGWESGSEDDVRIFAHLHDAQELLKLEGQINEIKALNCLCLDPTQDPLEVLGSEAEVWDLERESPRPAKEAFAEKGLEPIRLEAKDGLALLNGTQVSLALALEGV